MAAATTTAFERVLDRLRAAGKSVRQSGPGQARARCPAHDDRNASLSITANGDKVLVNCHAGCETGEVLAAIDMTTW